MSDKKPITPGFPDYPKAAADFDSLIRILTEERDRLRAELAEAQGVMERALEESPAHDYTPEWCRILLAFLDRTAPPACTCGVPLVREVSGIHAPDCPAARSGDKPETDTARHDNDRDDL